jgi:transcriptional regulator with XRE-family HTH domain
MDRNVEFDKFLKRIATNIRRFRTKAGLTQMDMLDHGFNYRHYQRLESGDTGYNLLTLFRLAKIFKVKVSALIDE